MKNEQKRAKLGNHTSSDDSPNSALERYDSELMEAGLALAAFHLEAGVDSYQEYESRIISELGENSRPFLRSWFEAFRHYPGSKELGIPFPPCPAKLEKSSSSNDQKSSPAPTTPNHPLKHERQVVLPLQWKTGQWVPLFDGEMPELFDGTMAELTLPASAFKNSAELRPFTEERTIPFLPKGTALWLALSANQGTGKTDQGLPTGIRGVDSSPGQDRFWAQFILKEDLELRLRGTKKARLENCSCSAPVSQLLKEEVTADSLNQICSRLSEILEPRRKSHAVNVYTHVFYRPENSAVLKPLSLLRDSIDIVSDLTAPPTEGPFTLS